MNFKVIVELFVVIFRKVIKVLKCKFIFKMWLGVLSSFYKGLVRNFEIKFKVFVFLVYKFFLIFILIVFIMLFLVFLIVFRKFEMLLWW